MKKLSFVFIIIFLFLSKNNFAEIKLIALTDAGNAKVTLEWNMVNYPGTTAYTLFKSIDGVEWVVAAANPVFRNYTAATILAYRDKFSDEQKLYYRVKVYDPNENIVDVSNTVTVANPQTNYHPQSNSANKKNFATTPETPVKNVWQIFPNPVGDVLNLVHRSNGIIKGVINIVIQDATGKVVTRFRAASKNQRISLPVSNLHAGIYFIKLNVMNEVQMNDKFIKE